MSTVTEETTTKHGENSGYITKAEFCSRPGSSSQL